MARRGQEGTTGEDTAETKVEDQDHLHKRIKKVYVIHYVEVIGGGGLMGVWVKG